MRSSKFRDLKIETPVHFEIVDQDSNGNRVAHLEASAPLPASVPITMTFATTRREEAADMVAAGARFPRTDRRTLRRLSGTETAWCR